MGYVPYYYCKISHPKTRLAFFLIINPIQKEKLYCFKEKKTQQIINEKDQRKYKMF